ncbi:type II secretion system F family protein [Bacillus fonticola]|uniref:type II secretion system F family protein n=1 Tax=Bacillus fonticola TaxID=2728853 RepID=UPI0014756C6D|nr:type II secretion system F family protein [Bacillus fonticola]
MKKLPLHEQIAFCDRMYKLLKEGYAVGTAWHLIEATCRPKWRGVYEEGRLQLEKGVSLHEVTEFHLQLHPTITLSLYVAEQSGQLAKGFYEAARLLQRSREDSTQFKKVLQYPLVLTMMTVFVLSVVKETFLPRILQLYDQFQEEKTFFMSLLIAFEKTPLASVVIGVASMLVVLLFFVGKWMAHHPYRTRQLLVQFPWLQQFFRHQHAFTVSLWLGSLMRSGCSLQEAIASLLKTPTCLPPWFTVLLQEMETELQKGHSFSSLTVSHPLFPRDFSLALAYGEQRGHIAEVFLLVSTESFQQMTEWVRHGIRMLQPIVLVGFAIIVVGLYIVILFPMLQMTNFSS